MAKNSKGKTAQIGPTQGDMEGMPSNPSDAIFEGAGKLNVIMPQAQTLRRSFSEQTRNPLYYNEGPGTDEVVTSRRPSLSPQLGSEVSDGDHQTLDGDCYGNAPTRDADGSTTTNGQPIRGT